MPFILLQVRILQQHKTTSITQVGDIEITLFNQILESKQNDRFQQLLQPYFHSTDNPFQRAIIITFTEINEAEFLQLKQLHQFDIFYSSFPEINVFREMSKYLTYAVILDEVKQLDLLGTVTLKQRDTSALKTSICPFLCDTAEMMYLDTAAESEGKLKQLEEDVKSWLLDIKRLQELQGVTFSYSALTNAGFKDILSIVEVYIFCCRDIEGRLYRMLRSESIRTERLEEKE